MILLTLAAVATGSANSVKGKAQYFGVKLHTDTLAHNMTTTQELILHTGGKTIRLIPSLTPDVLCAIAQISKIPAKIIAADMHILVPLADGNITSNFENQYFEYNVNGHDTTAGSTLNSWLIGNENNEISQTVNEIVPEVVTIGNDMSFNCIDSSWVIFKGNNYSSILIENEPESNIIYPDEIDLLSFKNNGISCVTAGSVNTIAVPTGSSYIGSNGWNIINISKGKTIRFNTATATQNIYFVKKILLKTSELTNALGLQTFSAVSLANITPALSSATTSNRNIITNNAIALARLTR